MIKGQDHYAALRRLAIVLNVSDASEFRDKPIEWLKLAYEHAVEGIVMPRLAEIVDARLRIGGGGH